MNTITEILKEVFIMNTYGNWTTQLLIYLYAESKGYEDQDQAAEVQQAVEQELINRVKLVLGRLDEREYYRHPERAYDMLKGI